MAETHPGTTFAPEVRAFIKSERWAGASYERIQRMVADTYKESIGYATVWRICNEDSAEVAAFNTERTQAVLDIDLEVAVETGRLIRNKLDDLSPYHLIGIYGQSRKSLQETLRLIQREHASNELLDAIERALTIPAAERRALIAGVIVGTNDDVKT